MSAVSLDAVHKVLHHVLRHLVTQLHVVLEDSAGSLSLQELEEEEIE